MKKFFIILLLFATALAGCDSDDSSTGTDTPNTPTVTTYYGTLAGTDETTGSLSISITENPASTSSVPTTLVSTYSVTGTLIINNNVIVLTGTFDGTTIAISGSNFTFTGTVNNGTLSGSFTGPNGVTGSFSASKGSNGATVKVYTGTFAGDATGILNIIVNGTSVTAVSISSSDGFANTLTGTVIGTSISVSSGTVTATGALSQDGSSCSGSWTDDDGGSGTWQATLVPMSIKLYVGTVSGIDGTNTIQATLRLVVNTATIGEGTPLTALVTGVRQNQDGSDNPVLILGSVSGSPTHIEMQSDDGATVSGDFNASYTSCSGTWDNNQPSPDHASGTWQAMLVNP